MNCGDLLDAAIAQPGRYQWVTFAQAKALGKGGCKVLNIADKRAHRWPQAGHIAKILRTASIGSGNHRGGIKAQPRRRFLPLLRQRIAIFDPPLVGSGHQGCSIEHAWP